MSIISYADTHRFPVLFSDYTGGKDSATRFFAGDFRKPETFAAVLMSLAATYKTNRQTLADALKKQNEQFGSSPETLANIEKLRDAKTFAVVTGQQTTVFTGSLYTIYKTISTLQLARQLQHDFPDYAFVPVFWLEAEDSDYAEFSSIHTLSQNKVSPLAYTQKGTADGQMMSRVKFSQEIFHFTNSFLGSLQSSDFKDGLTDLLRSAYSEGETFSSAFAKLMARLFATDGLILFSVDDPKMKRLGQSIFQKELLNAPKTSELVISQSASLEESGYNVQAKPKPVNLHVITADGVRQLIEPKDSKFELRITKETLGRNELIELATSSPERFSPNVITRPLLQDTILPTVAYVAGPGEVSYLAQLKTAYAFFGITMPVIYPRASVSLVEPKIKKVFDKYGFTLAEFYASKDNIIKKAVGAVASVDIEAGFAKAAASLQATLDELNQTVRPLDPTLSEALANAGVKMQQNFSSLKEKAFRSEKQKNSDLTGQIDKAFDSLLPNDDMQERTLNVFYFLNKYGLDFLKTLQSKIDLHADGHQLIDL
jgi:bacillithiol biosynthesis cysteine-adding enzyme BshC